MKAHRFLNRLVTVCLAGLVILWTTSSPGSDAAWYDQSSWVDSSGFGNVPTPASQYLVMRDGTRLAVSVYLPTGLSSQERIPTLLLQTRYWRGGGEPGFYAALFLPHGFAFVAVDVRGTGASFGTRRYTLAPDEVADSKEILDWIAAQSWSNGKIATAGGSYTGATAATTLSHAHPAHVAAIPANIAFDLFENGFFPGGVYMRHMVRRWQRFTAELDNNGGGAMGFPGLLPVDADPDRSLLTAALKEHEGNFRIHDVLSTAEFRDDVRADALGDPMQVGDLTLHKYASETAKSRAAILDMSGWFDGGLLMGAIHRHLRFPGERNRLVLGPWDHNGHYVSPWRNRREGVNGSRSARSDFDVGAHYLRFLKANVLKNQADDDASVHYFTMGAERWNAAKSWPPAGSVSKTYYFAEGGALGAEAPDSQADADDYEVDFSTRTGLDTRWASIVNFEGRDIVYSNRVSQQSKLLTYTTPPLADDVEVTGHPRVELYLSATTTDVAVHVYLEDVGGPDDVRYVTEGVLKASHRKVGKAPYPSPVVYHSHLKKDHQPLVPGEVVKLTIDLYPTSYLFKKGRSIRIGIAGADKTMFARVPPDETVPVMRVQRNRDHASRVLLPVMRTVEPRKSKSN